MSGRDLYRSVLQCNGGFSTDCPAGMSGDMSPMTTLAVNLWHGASVSQTPRRRLSLGSTSSDTSVPAISPTALSFRDSISSDSDCSDILSPSRRRLSIDKENHNSPYFTPSSTSTSSAIPHRQRTSPLKEVQNTVERNISPQKKQQLLSPSKRLSIRAQFTSPPKKLEVPLPDDFDTNSQDSGYSESGKKYEDSGFSVPVTCAPRKLNLDFSPPKSVAGHSVSPVKNFLTSIFSSSSDAKTVCVPPNTLPAVTALPQSSTPVTSVAKSKAKSTSNATQEERTPFRTFSSLISKDKEEDEDPFLMELLDDVNMQEDQPSGMSSLLKAPINSSTPSSVPSSTATSISQRLSVKLDTPVTHKPSIRRCLSMMDTTPTSVTAQRNLEPSISFKRPNPPADLNSLVDCKRRRSDDMAVSENKEAPQEPQPSTRPPLFPFRQLSNPESSRPSGAEARPKLQRCHSESHVSIMKAVSRSTQDQTLIGDCSKPYVLPLINSGKHPDLKAISVDTMASLIRGDFDDKVASYTILDCRYPYEYEGGHIVRGVNWPHPGKVVEFLEEKKGAPVGPCEKAPRNILIFHCEFSAERGPRALRQLREKDRSTNKDYYPALHFPEIYLLEGGYKAFYERYPELCVPTEYTRMLDPKHSEDLKHFRAKSKSWAAENKHAKQGRLTLISRPGLKRLTLQ
ncbi:M-phase inducer phosphatase-like [Oratosquilla oratoria]|uniref:M-phase inducer phosphatase-like n=1 Tax=Oratosquilla oratoria TaxID=337810 RepID=UPI003F75A731